MDSIRYYSTRARRFSTLISLPFSVFALLVLWSFDQWGLVTVLAIGLSVGTGLVFWGSRQFWRQTDHRYCGACGYDLMGVPLRTPETICPECGEKYSSRGVQTFFVVRLSLWMIIAGVMLQALPVFIALLRPWR